MGKRLDTKDANILSVIEKKFSKKKSDAVIEANKNGEQMLSTIEFFKSYSFEEICELRRKEIVDKYANMDNKTALRNATIYAFKTKGRENVPEKDIQEIIKKVTPEVAKTIIGRYKKIACEQEIKDDLVKAKLDYDFFSSVPDEEKINFSAIYQEMCLADDLFKARKQSIIETAKEFNLDLPSCITNIGPLYAESENIAGITDANENEKTFISKMKDKFNKVADYFDENQNAITLSGALSFVSGACAFLGYINHKADATPAMALAVGTASVMMAGLMTLYNSSEIRSFFKDKKSINEAKDLGLLGQLVYLETAMKSYNDISEKYKTDYIKEFEKKGGSNGLH